MTASNVLEGVDLILIDWHMPHLNGLELIRAEKAAPGGAAPELMPAKEAEKTNEAGAKNDVVKTFTSQVIRETIRLVIGG